MKTSVSCSIPTHYSVFYSTVSPHRLTASTHLTGLCSYAMNLKRFHKYVKRGGKKERKKKKGDEKEELLF